MPPANRFVTQRETLSGSICDRKSRRSIGPGGRHAAFLTIFTKDAENRFHNIRLLACTSISHHS
jgi:hypothetical protein